MNCLLCFECNNDYIDLACDEGKNLKIAFVLFKHFQFVFQDEPQNGKICRKCWWKVDMFHEFYNRIEEIHTSVLPNVVVIENLIQDLKNDDSLKNENEFDRFSDVVGDFLVDNDFETNGVNSDLDEPVQAKTETVVEKTIPESKPLIEPTSQEDAKFENPKSDWDSETPSSESMDDDQFGKPVVRRTSFKCNFCQKVFPGRSKMHRHMRDKHNSDIHQCQICRRVLLSERSLKRHTHKLHSSTKVKGSRSTWEEERPAFKSFQCKICFEFFLTEQHMQRHHKEIHLALPFKCKHTKCIESFETAELLETHRKDVHAKSPCPLCGKQVMTIFLEQHFERMHNKDKQAVCEQCGKVFPNNYMLKSHVRSEHDDPERLQCDICKGTFRNKYNLQKHMRIIHIDKPQACDICGKISPNSKALRSHLYVHKQPDKECIVCGKRFKHSSKLREHSYTHSGVTDAYECNFCGKKFRFGSSWSAHKMKYHPVEMAESKERLERIKRNAMKKTGNAQLLKTSNHFLGETTQ